MKFIKDNKTGSYYSIENGEMVQYPMNLDGSRCQEFCAIDWDFVAYEMPLNVNGKEIDIYKHLKKIERKLK